MRSLLLAFLTLPVFASAQGSLTPPAAPAPTMRTLTQIEPRVPLEAGAPGIFVNSANGDVTIGSSGSYYLTGNLTVSAGNAITIVADNVTLDLNGFTISTTASPAGGSAIGFAASIQRNITIRNGHIASGITVSAAGTPSGNGFKYGVYSVGRIENVRVSDLGVSGVSSAGILLDWGSTIERCVVQSCGDTGISGQVITDCSATECGTTAIHGTTVSNSQGSAIHDTGLFAETATNCRGSSVANSGLFATVASGCYGTSTSGVGLRAKETATGCFGSTISGDYGLLVAVDAATLGTAENCSGRAPSSGIGLSAGVATNCTGTSLANVGLLATTATNCIGTSTSSFGLQADTASNCTGISVSGQRGLYIIGTASYCLGKRPGGIALSAAIAIGCTSAAGDILASNRYLMP